MSSRPTLGAHMAEDRRAEQLARLAVVRDEPLPPEPPDEMSTDVDTETPEALPPARRTSFTARELMAMDFPEPRFAVPGIIPEGLTVFAGPPKAGKSWFAYNAALAVAAGGLAFGKVPVTSGDVLYLSLEDPPRRLKQRLTIMLAGEPPPDRLTLATACERFPDGIDRIRKWLTATPDARLVIVDVFAKVRPHTGDKGNQYLADYAAVAPLKALADDHGVAILLLHHVRKMGSEDFVDTISGTNGIAGAADTIMVLKRARNAADGILSITGRDVNEAEHALSFDAAIGTWQLLEGPAAVYDMADTRRKILAAVTEAEGIGPTAIAKATGIALDTIKQTVRRMLDTEPPQLDTDGQGHYFPPVALSHLSPPSPSTPGSPSDSDSGDRSDTPLEGVDQ